MLTTIHEVNQRMRQRMPSAAKSCAPWLVLAGSVALFAYFYPILSACALEDKQAFLKWAWLKSWI